MKKKFVVAAMYKFVELEDFASLQPKLLAFCRQYEIKGTILLAKEGINGTVVGTRKSIDSLKACLKLDKRFADLDYKESVSNDIPFYRTRVKLKKEIVTLGQPGIKPSVRTGVRVDPKNWNSLVNDPAVLLIDTRNTYEYRIGTFKNAVSPETTRFREFPNFVTQKLDPNRTKKVALFCTGGIRCEKAGAYMLEQGFEEVYQLNGGILKYLAEVSSDESLWQGECFVFDGRVSVDHDLAEGKYEQCFACRRPLSREDQQSKDYQQGVSCPYCIDEKTESQRAGFRERQYQVELAEQRNEKHIGAKT